VIRSHPYLSAPDVDHEVRWYLLKLADMLVRGAEEQPPKVTIHLPPTPVTEVPPPLPVVKLKARPSVKIDNTPVTHSPLTPFATAPKLKLLPGGSVTPGPSSTTPTVKRIGSSAIAVPKAPKQVPVPPRSDHKPPSKHVPRARSGGMELSDLHACRNMLRKLQTNKHATLFLQPVDPIRDRAPR
jgi:transcription initiation factor TFIID subunit 2